MGGIILSYENGNYYAQYGEDTATKKVLGEISKEQLIAVLANSGLGLTLDSTPEEIYAVLATKFPQQLSMLVSGWIYSGTPNASVKSDDTRVTMTITSTPLTGWAEYNSPLFDFTAFKTLQFAGSAYKYTHNSGEVYAPRIFLLDQDGKQVASLYQHNGKEKTIENINKTVNIAGYTGKYSLQLAIYSYNNDSSKNDGAYISLSKALLAT